MDLSKLLRGFRSSWLLLVIVVATMTLFNVAQIWLNGWWYFLDMAIVLALMAACIKLWRIPLADLGLTKSNLKKGLKYGSIVILSVGLVLGTAYLIRPETFLDSRYHIGWLRALALMFMVIPFRIVFFEEFLFRGMLLSSLKKVTSWRWVVAWSSVTFGLWHIVPSLHLSTSNQTLNSIGSTTSHAALVAILIAVVATALAGGFLSWLRLKSRSLLAPIMVHWSINAFSVGLVVAAYLKLGLH